MAANSTNSDVKKVFEIFGKCMFKEFDQMFASIYDKVTQKVSSTTYKVLKFTGVAIPACESPFATVRDVGIRAVDEVKDAYSLRKATKMESLAYKWSDEEEGMQMRETLCQAALALFVSLYPNITRVTTKQGTDRKAIETLAKVAVSNFENWYTEQPETKPFSVELITEGVTTNVKTKLPSLYKQPELYDKLTKTEYNDPIKLFTKPALVADDGINAQTYYANQSRKHPLKYGYRFLFEHELKTKSVLNGYEQLVNREINLVKPELETGIWRELLNAIREEDPNLMEARLKDHVDQALQNNYRTADVDIDYCPAPVDTFLGRSEELAALKTLFTQHQVVALVGMGGMGKTQLSRKYVQVNKAKYQYKYWLESETPEKLENSFKKLAKKLHIEPDNIDEVVNDVYKKIQAVPTILVFDNVEKPADVYGYLPTRVDLPPDVTIHVLVTSRWSDWTCDNQIECYKLQPFNILESLEIFEEYFGKSCIETMKHKWEELAKMLGYLPLALKITAPAIHKLCKHNSELDTVLADYMKQIREGASRLLKYPVTEYANRTIYESMLLPLKQFENKTDDEWQLAGTLINAAAYMYPDGIRKERLLKLIANDENAWILDQALVILTDYSLFDQLVYSDKKCYTVHRIMQASLRHNHIENGTADMYYTAALKCDLANDYRPRHLDIAHVVYVEAVLRYANERASAIVDYYKENRSSSIFTYLVQCKAITAVQAVFEQMTANEIQSVIRQQALLYHAVWSENLSMIQLLCNNGADINQVTDQFEMLPLHLAVQLQNMEIVKWLLENGAKPSLRDSHGSTALVLAFSFRNFEMASEIIKTDKALIENIDFTLLHNVGYSFNTKDFLSAVQFLLAKGADIAAVNDNGDTVLYLAAGNACAAAVSLILQRKKDLINIVNNNGRTALHNVCHNYDGSLDKNQHICSTIRVLLENGADLTKVDNEGNTVLHAAAKYACAPAVSLILQFKNDLINIVNASGNTALQEVCCYGYIHDELIPSTVRVLVDNGGADLTKVDSQGNTVLHLAACRADVATVTLILQRKKDLINIVNEDGQTALHVISYDGICTDERIASTVRVLVDNDADLTKMDSQGNTVLHLAARTVRAPVVSLILQRKKDVINIVNEDGQTALHVLGNSILFPFQYNSEETAKKIIQMLIMNGLSLDARDNRGRTPLETIAPQYKDLLLQVAGECNT